jgi:hypothetical protein
VGIVSATPESFLPALKILGSTLASQDNRATDAPIFIVEQKVRTYGVGFDYTDAATWVCEDEPGEVSADLAASLEAGYRAGLDPPEGYARVGYLDHWEFVTACFTEDGCRTYIATDGHNLREPRIYAAGSYRNMEWRTVRSFLVALGAEL